MASLDSKASSVLGDRTSKVLDTTFGIKSVGDLLRHYPRRYAVRGELTDISTLQEAMKSQFLLKFLVLQIVRFMAEKEVFSKSLLQMGKQNSH